MNPNSLYITPDDYAKLRLLIGAARPSGHAALKKLAEELDRATVIDAAAMPAGVVMLESHVEYQDLVTGEMEAFTLTLPERANVEEKRLSVIAPIGTALIGYRAGDIVNWVTPGGPRELKILRVVSPVSPRPASQATAGVESSV